MRRRQARRLLRRAREYALVVGDIVARIVARDVGVAVGVFFHEADVEEYIRRIKMYGSCPELTREMCLQLIEFITIDAKTERNNRWHSPAPRNIHIYYKLIDKEHAKPNDK